MTSKSGNIALTSTAAKVLVTAKTDFEVSSATTSISSSKITLGAADGSSTVVLQVLRVLKPDS